MSEQEQTDPKSKEFQNQYPCDVLTGEVVVTEVLNLEPSKEVKNGTDGNN